MHRLADRDLRTRDYLEPRAYFADVLANLVNLWAASRIDDLMPCAWAAARAANKRAA
jgi:transposase